MELFGIWCSPYIYLQAIVWFLYIMIIVNEITVNMLCYVEYIEEFACQYLIFHPYDLKLPQSL